jgi:hypothetical protein
VRVRLAATLAQAELWNDMTTASITGHEKKKTRLM